jgi:hypothetical protein
MAKADSVHSTPPTNSPKIAKDRAPIPGRRAFLFGVAALSVAATITGPAITLSPDPIFAAIEAHKAARAIWIANVDRQLDLENELPKDKRRSFLHVDRDEILETDDPRWIECEREIMRTSDLETDAACILVSIVPTTQAGVVALLQYALLADTDGEGWPRDLISDDGTKARSWHYFLIENVTAALTDLVLA